MKTVNSLLLIGLSVVASSALVRSSDQKTSKLPSASVPSGDFSIVSGRSIGKVQLGDSPEKVHQILGDWSSMVLNGQLGDEVEGYKSGLAVFYRRYKVAEIRVTSSQYKTPEGVSVGSSPEVVRKNFKGGTLSSSKIHFGSAPNKITETRTLYSYTDAKRGIRFQFGDNQQHSTKRCDTIAIIQPMP